MTSVAEADQILFAHLFEPLIRTLNIKLSSGRILAETILADRDLPPYDRATMDGIALSFCQIQAGNLLFDLQGTQAAGQPQQKLVIETGAMEVMTGAMLPVGADTVIPYEQIEIKNGQATILNADIVEGMNVHRQGSDAKAGSVMLQPGQLISPAEVALFAASGHSKVNVYEMPTVAILSTGDELVDIEAQPLQHQIRKSNSYAIQSALRTLGCNAEIFHLNDQLEELTLKIKCLLSEFPILIISGGASKGKFDFVPKALETNGVTKLFYQVSQRPGRPFWFGTTAENRVFALPGNPVSTFMCFYRYVKPWLLKNLKQEIRFYDAILARDFQFDLNLTYFLQVRVTQKEGKILAFPYAGGGSGDFVNLKETDGFLELPARQNHFKAGEVYPLITFR